MKIYEVEKLGYRFVMTECDGTYSLFRENIRTPGLIKWKKDTLNKEDLLNLLDTHPLDMLSEDYFSLFGE